MTSRTYMKKKIYLKYKLAEYAKAHGTSAPAEIKAMNKSKGLGRPDFTKFKSYDDAWSKLYKALEFIGLDY
ncbi:MAG: hypothetical protein KBS66_07475 [Eubacterium sp.]|nr:hypothetical protein [Candidatus Colimonas fimequi]